MSSEHRAQILDQFTLPDARIAVAFAGVLPYFANRDMIDLLGKNDKKVAHETVRVAPDTAGYLDFRPGHMKWDYAYAIGQQQPDVVSQLWSNTAQGESVSLLTVPADAEAYLRESYVRVTVQGRAFYVRRGSTNVRWQLVTVAQ